MLTLSEDLNGDAKRLLCAKNVVELLMINCEKILAVFVCSPLTNKLESLKILKKKSLMSE